MNTTARRAASHFWRSRILNLPACSRRWNSTFETRKWSTPLARTLASAMKVFEVDPKILPQPCLQRWSIGGYYTSRPETGAVFGKHGDFVTSPEISQVFGELIGIWTIAEWMSQGRNKSGVQLMEVGPGKGTLMDDMLRTFRNFKSFSSSIEAIYLVEASHTLREMQRQLLCGDSPMEETEIGHRSICKYFDVPVVWVEDIRLLPHEIMTPTGPQILHKPLKAANTPQWRELLVTLNPKAIEENVEGEPEFQLSRAKASTPSSLVIPEISERFRALKSQPGSTIEVSPESRIYAADFARRIGGDASSALASKKNSTAPPPQKKTPSVHRPDQFLRGIQHHRKVPPLSAPGQVDVSADVDFTSLAEAAIEGSDGVEVHGPVEQGDFLNALGITERMEQLLRKAGDEEKRKTLETGWKRLVMAIVPENSGRRRPVGFGGSVQM
ncbi:hypothetical protein N7468_005980 [Penicillium chermesinum]|uniref:Protein arginine methyltransferase NDUFAF7 n=1 Tax=Penicillium chermesinum TaxID=63820 RepID=A0A9W9P0B4_9EURO|nr:uncharacterized protein N7468_005980 [Penicillium chermesinum]KAJ5233024.1 hypothetical protein N7468_005980 [Penicillium chermesinum]